MVGFLDGVYMWNDSRCNSLVRVRMLNRSSRENTIFALGDVIRSVRNLEISKNGRKIGNLLTSNQAQNDISQFTYHVFRELDCVWKQLNKEPSNLLKCHVIVVIAKQCYQYCANNSNSEERGKYERAMKIEKRVWV